MATGLHLTKKELRHLRLSHRRTKSKRKSYRINALVLLGQGWTYAKVSEALLIDESTLANYVRRYRSGGIPALLKDDYKGYTGKLMEHEIKLLDAHLQEVTYRRVIDIIAYVEDEFDVTYTVSGMTELLHRLAYSYKKPRKVPGKADPTAQAEFIERYKEIRSKMKKDDHLFFMDGVHPQHNPLVMNGWIKVGVDKNIRTNTRYHRLNINGAIDIDGLEVVTQFSARLNEESTLDFLEKLRKKCPKGRLHLVLDNAGYYTASRIKEYAEALGIELHYLPPYSPNLNLIERLWLYFQKNVLYNCYYPTFDKFEAACKGFFKAFKKHRPAVRQLMTENFEVIVP